MNDKEYQQAAKVLLTTQTSETTQTDSNVSSKEPIIRYLHWMQHYENKATFKEMSHKPILKSTT